MFMKRILFLASVAVTAFGAISQETGKAMAFFSATEHDFGYIKEADGPVSCTFEFTNEGESPLIIIDATASCGCTRPEYPTKPIKPGKKGKIKVTFNPAGRPGAFRKTVKIRTNGKKKNINLNIDGCVIPKDEKH